MKAIVTGSNGFIGYNLCQELKVQKWQVLGIDDLSNGRKENVVAGFRYEWAKVEDRDNTRKLMRDFQPDVIFHLAALPRVAYSVENPYATAVANVLGTISLLEGVVKAGLVGTTRVVCSSSSSVYGGADVMPTAESQPCQPQSPYALEKYHGEQWCEMFASLYGLDVVSLRYFNVFGPHALFGGAYSTVLSAWLYHLYVDPSYSPFLEGDGKQTRDFCFVDNAVQANFLAGTRQERFDGQAINVAQGSSHSLLDCKDLLEKIAGKQFELVQKPPRVGDVKHTLADISLAKSEFGYSPSVDFEEQVSRTASWYENSYPSLTNT
jgi:nucleoside-diphosphate-sugar epimerase